MKYPLSSGEAIRRINSRTRGVDHGAGRLRARIIRASMPTNPAFLILPFAGALSDAGRQALHDLPLPRLERLLARMTPTQRIEGDEFTLLPPHERALAHALGWTAADGCLPLAARLAAEAGLTAPADTAWGLLTPV